MTLLLYLIGVEEGFDPSGQRQDIPTERHNPMDLTHAPNETHAPGDPNGIGFEPTVAAGDADGERQLELWAGRGYTLEKAIYTQCPPDDGVNPLLRGNDSAKYLADIIAGFAQRGYTVTPDTPLSQVLKISV